MNDTLRALVDSIGHLGHFDIVQSCQDPVLAIRPLLKLIEGMLLPISRFSVHPEASHLDESSR